ncbi:MAG: zf-HC2 domain-containing protein [Candidatus Omnitrophota bacterium]
MNCKKIRQVILTDYLDGEMDAKGKSLIDEHMAKCPVCKSFYLNVKKASEEVFLNAKCANPPEYVWRRIKEGILSEREKKKSFVPDILSGLKSILYIPKPAFAIASVLILVIAIGTMAHFRSGYNRAAAEQLDYFNYLTVSSADASANNSTGLGTTIEKYFM